VPLVLAVAIEGAVVDSIEWKMPDQRIHLLQRSCQTGNRPLVGVIGEVPLHRVLKRPCRSLAIDPDFSQFVQSLQEVPLRFFAVGGAGALAQSSVAFYPLVDVPDVTAVNVITLQ